MITTQHTVQASDNAAPARAGALSRDRLAVLAGLVGPLALAAVLVPFRTGFPNTDAALALVLVVVAVAANGNRLAGLLAALSATVWFDFFLTRPYERFAITGRTHRDHGPAARHRRGGHGDRRVGPPPARGRQQARGLPDGINAAARAVATGDSPTALIEQVSGQLTELLSLRSCRFQYGIAGWRPPGCSATGRSRPAAGRSGHSYEDLPLGFDTELLVETSGLLQGRFLMTPGPEAVFDP